jgi:O-acetyl-ADP-ribose deacetylase (regulator of RNase III)
MYYHYSDILDQKYGVIVHGVNGQGVMGSGLARHIRERYPNVYHQYKNLPMGRDALGKFQIVSINTNLYIGNAFTQLYYGKDGKRYASVDAIYNSLRKAFSWCMMCNYPLLSPKIGCGLGGLNWDIDVLPIFMELEKEYPDVDVSIFELK